MLQRTNAELTPTATPAPPTPVPTEAPTPVTPSTATPVADLGDAYFGRTFVAVVPGKTGTAVPMTEFSVQDQLGLYVEKLDERLHLGFKWRLFDLDSGGLLADASGETMQRIQENFVWYHQGHEPVGHYRGELYAGDVLTNTFEYMVGTEPVAIPSPFPTLALTAEPSVAASPVQPSGVAQVAATSVSTSASTSASTGSSSSRVVSPAPVSTPLPTPVPTPAPTLTPEPPPPKVTTVSVAAGPVALAAGLGSDQVFVADRSGLVWVLEHGQPTLRQPFSLSGEPVGLAVDMASSRLYVALRNPAELATLDLATGQPVGTEPLPANPGDLALDTDTGQLYVVLPDRDAIETIDTRSGKVLRITTGLHHVTGEAVDAVRHRLYVSQLEGDVSVVETSSGTIVATLHLSDVGLSGVTSDTDHLYAINTPGQMLITVDWSTTTAQADELAVAPAAVAFGPNTASVYILAADASVVTRVNPNDSTDMSDIALGDSGGAGDAQWLDPDQLWRRPRLVPSPADDTIYIIQPEAATLAIASSSP